jgi:hypothetical protein
VIFQPSKLMHYETWSIPWIKIFACLLACIHTHFCILMKSLFEHQTLCWKAASKIIQISEPTPVHFFQIKWCRQAIWRFEFLLYVHMYIGSCSRRQFSTLTILKIRMYNALSARHCGHRARLRNRRSRVRIPPGCEVYRPL